MKGFKKGAIYDVFNHREKNDLHESFPAVLFVNFNLQAASWAAKESPIQKADYRIAVENHVLIVRIEDLVHIWDAITRKKIAMEDVLNIFLSEVGWLECKGDKLIVHK